MPIPLAGRSIAGRFDRIDPRRNDDGNIGTVVDDRVVVVLCIIGTIGGYRRRIYPSRATRRNCRCLVNTQHRPASYQPRAGEAFAFTAELDLKLEQLAEIEKDFAAADRPEESAVSTVG